MSDNGSGYVWRPEDQIIRKRRPDKVGVFRRDHSRVSQNLRKKVILKKQSTTNTYIHILIVFKFIFTRNYVTFWLIFDW